MEGVPPSFMDVDVNQLDLQAQEDNFNMSELPSSPEEEVPVNQSSMLCNDQAGQKTLVDNDVIYDSIQQTTQFPPSFPQPMMEGAPPSFVDDTLMSELQPSFPQTMTAMGGLDGTSSSSWINQNGPNGPQTSSSSRQFPYQSNQVPIMPNPYDPQCSTMLPEPSQTLRQEAEAAARIQVSKITSSNSLHKEPPIKMTRPCHELWAYVDKLDDGTTECKYCDHKYGEGTSITRIRLHLSGVTGKGVKPCGKVPKDIKEVALARNGSSRIPPGEDLVGRLAGHNWKGMYAESTAFLLGENSETRGDPLPTSSTMLEEAFEENTRKIGSWIMDDEVSTIGIYGMAGVGKTELLKHIHNKLLQSQDSTHRLYWMHVSQNFSIKSLQNFIELRLNQRWILFLDDLGGDFKLDAVGIPETIKGCKLIVSTRSEKVCLTVASRGIIVNPLSHEEAMSLFMKNLGPDIELSPPKKQFAKCIVNKCGGLPLGIIAMARSMRSLPYNIQWKNALQDLEKSSAGQSHMERALSSLKSSYTHLKKFDQQEVFLRCALFPKSFMIPKDDLIAFLIDDGVIKMQNSREAEFRTGHGLIDRLEGVCLLESIDGGSAVKMRDLIRDMAIEKYQEYYPVIIKAGENLKNLSSARDWGGSLVTASLIENQIKEIPSIHSPRCPSLSTLLLHYNRELELIEDPFFNQLHGLKILDLSHTVIEKLPDSVSNLVRLTTLLLIDCKKLVHVPSLEKLKEMRRLDLYHTALENIPQGLECLSELRYLRMSNCGQKEFPGGILLELSHLQVLILGWGKYAPMTVKVEEVGCLKKLEVLECHFNGHSDLVKFFNYRDQTHSLKTYKVRVGQFEENDDFLAELDDWGNNQIEENDGYLLFHDVR